MSNNQDVSRRSSGTLDFSDLCVCQVTAYENKRRCHVVEAEVAQVGHILTAPEYPDGTLKVRSREQYQGDAGASHNVSKPEAGELIVESERSQIADSNPAASEENPAARKIST